MTHTDNEEFASSIARTEAVRRSHEHVLAVRDRMHEAWRALEGARAAFARAELEYVLARAGNAELEKYGSALYAALTDELPSA